MLIIQTICTMPPKSRREFREKWLQHPDFCQWLEKIEGNRIRAYCKVCRVDLSAEISGLKRHKSSASHTICAEEPRIDNQPTMSDDTENDMVGRAEIKLVTFMAEHNISFNTADHLVDILKDIFPDSAIVKRVSLERSKAAYLIKEVAKVSHNTVISDLKANKF